MLLRDKTWVFEHKGHRVTVDLVELCQQMTWAYERNSGVVQQRVRSLVTQYFQATVSQPLDEAQVLAEECTRLSASVAHCPCEATQEVCNQCKQATIAVYATYCIHSVIAYQQYKEAVDAAEQALRIMQELGQFREFQELREFSRRVQHTNYQWN